MLVDVLIVGLVVSALYRGHEIGFVRQMLSTAGFFVGLFIGVWLQHYTIRLVHTDLSRTLVTAATTLGCAIIVLTIGEYAGMHVKHRVRVKRINALDNWFGSALGAVSLLVSAWLMAAIVSSLPFTSLQIAVERSRIVSGLNQLLPNAPGVIAELGRLVDPNGFPQVFVGSEPAPRGDITPPSLGDLQAAVAKDKASVVKIEGQGCGGIVEGSGFVVGSDLVATNAHVVAGIRRPFVRDGNGSRGATPVLFNPNLDLAVLRVKHLAGGSLSLSGQRVPSGTGAAVLGYPGGGSFQATSAAVLDEFDAHGRNIYDQRSTDRDVYEVYATIIPGNSGGPLVARDGSVIGVVFAESTTYQHVGYALAMSRVIQELKRVNATTPPVRTGSCAD